MTFTRTLFSVLLVSVVSATDVATTAAVTSTVAVSAFGDPMTVGTSVVDKAGCQKPAISFKQGEDGQGVDATKLVHAYVCQEVAFTVVASDANVNDDVSIFVSEDPGMPNGAKLSKNECPPPVLGQGGTQIKVPCNAVSRVFKWTPAKTQVDKKYTVCFVPRDNSEPAGCKGASATGQDNGVTLRGGLYGAETCVVMQVIKPVPVWNRPPTPVHDKNIVGHVGCASTTTFTIECQETAYCVKVWSTKTNPLPTYSTFSKCLGRSKEPTDSGEIPCAKCARTFSWRPRRGQEAHNYRVCFRCSDDVCDSVLHDGHMQSKLPILSYAMEGGKHETCVNIEVRRCRYCVKQGDSLNFLNRYYHLDTNWLRLWNSNGADDLDKTYTSTIRNPDAILEDEQVINVGPIYRVNEGDTLLLLGKRFQTTMKKILSVNPDVSAGADLKIGQELCVLPCTDMPNYETYDNKDSSPTHQTKGECPDYLAGAQQIFDSKSPNICEEAKAAGYCSDPSVAGVCAKTCENKACVFNEDQDSAVESITPQMSGWEHIKTCGAVVKNDFCFDIVLQWFCPASCGVVLGNLING